ncbi:MAG: type IV secretion system DNA-binding domain-containing protein [Acidobacteriota bacterium]|nr:type IV secretion system DNA-binding domain-containing protein [Acidobacteriota bacterium]
MKKSTKVTQSAAVETSNHSSQNVNRNTAPDAMPTPHKQQTAKEAIAANFPHRTVGAGTLGRFDRLSHRDAPFSSLFLRHILEIARQKPSATRVFLTSSSGYREKLLPLHSVWLDLFILRMMAHSPDAQPVWFVLDELASLNKLPQLHTAVTENRKYGNPVVLGFQGRSQLEKRYGRDAEAMLSQPATKVFFRTSEPRAAKWISEAIGEIEVERLKESRSMGLLRSKKSYAMEIATKPLVMASEIAGLDSHCAYIKQENRVVPVRFRLAKKRKRQPEFIESKMEKPAPRKPAELPLPASAPMPAPAQAPPKQPVKSALPLINAPAGKREGFVWDASQEVE